MLTLRPQPAPTRFPDRKMYERRGRSTQVSHTALARQASEERRTLPQRGAPLPTKRSRATERPSHVEPFPPSDSTLALTPVPIKVTPKPEPVVAPPRSPSPPASASMSPEYLDSPPTPPQSLEDQVHIAYALDDIHLAKVLLLKLKGIEVTSDEDPRIAAVQDEDFDMCFFPHGKLMDDADEKALFEQQRKEMEKLEERRREDRLRACERIWEEEKKRSREARALAMKRKEAEERRQAEEEENRIKVAKEKVAKEKEAAERRARMYRTRSAALPSRNVVSYQSLGRSRTGSSHVTSRGDEPFVYPFMAPAPRHLKHPKSTQTPAQTPAQTPSQPFTRPTYDESRTVPFRDVLASMQGHLFPVERDTSPSSSQDQHKDDLLDALLRVVEWEADERRKLKGKWTERPVKGSNKSASSCVACSISSPSMSSSLLSSSRRSWLSFSSAPSSSASTAITTPSTSPPRSSWFSKPVAPSSSASTPRNRPASLVVSNPPVPAHSCETRARLIPVALSECPLSMPTSNKPLTTLAAAPSEALEHTQSSDRVMRRVSRIVEIAKEFQNAYVNATLLAVMSSSDAVEGRTVTTASVSSFPGHQPGRHQAAQPTWWRPKRAGCRARAADVTVFLNTPSNRDRSQDRSVYSASIPLKPWHSSSNPPRTILPHPLPYPIVFKPLPKPCRSPFSLYAHIMLAHRRPMPAPWNSPLLDEPNADPSPATNGTITWRMRTVENPMFLRLKALQNVLWEDGVNWQGRAREGNMGAGREKVMKVAVEGIGRSWLGGRADVVSW